MYLTKLHIKNFKTFKDETITFGKLNILVGPNASGKSNTVSVFRFINQIITCGIDNAISLSGGIEYVLNTSIGRSQPLYLSFSVDCKDNKFIRAINEQGNKVLFDGFDYEFEITPNKRGNGFRITQDHIRMRYYELLNDTENGKYSFDPQKYCIIDCKRNGSKLIPEKDDKMQLGNKKTHLDWELDFFIRYMKEVGHMKELILSYPILLLPPFFHTGTFIRIFDFDTKAMKKASLLIPGNRLEEDASNLASVLQELLKNTKERKKLENLLKDCLPFLETISTEKNFDKSISYKIKESYSSKPLYANFISDGTVNIIAIILALYFERLSGIIILEEPERNLHPFLMSNLLDMATEQSQKKQIIITTHTPELVKHSDINTLLLAKRNNDGFTHITYPANNVMVKEFMNEEVGIDNLFINNLLGE